jgi:shikimate dehydrogenase
MPDHGPLERRTNGDKRYGFTRLIASVGYPAGTWPAAAIYNACFQNLGLDWRYVPLPVPGGQLREALQGLRALGFSGAELAATYQREALDYLDHVSPAAEMLEGTRLVQVDEGGRLLGDRMYWLGFLAALRALVPSLDGLRPLIMGTQGKAADVVYALTREGVPITILDARIERGVDLVHRLRHAMDEHSFSVYRWPDDLARVAGEVNLIVNTMVTTAEGRAIASPWPAELSFPRDAVVFDLTSLPVDSPFLHQARRDGAQTLAGFSLQVYESALAVERWTGQPRPVKVMMQIAREILARPAAAQHYPLLGEHSWIVAGEDFASATS